MKQHSIYRESYGIGQDVVMVHGWCMHTGIWREFAQELSKFCKVTCLDLPGHGRSAMIKDYSLDGITEALLDSVSAKAVWIGWSLGATVVLNIASRFPNQVHSVMLIAGTPRFVQSKHWSDAMALTSLDVFMSNLEHDFDGTLVRFLKLQTRGAELARESLQLLRTRLTECDPPDLRALNGGLDILRTADMRHVMRNLDCPGCIVLGEKDTLVPVTVGDAIKALWPSAQCHVIDKAGHVPFISHLQETVSYTQKFLANHR